jgi:hypothetical protein
VKLAVLATALVCSSVRAEVPHALAGHLVQHCTRCHNERHSLDLRTPPPETDQASWSNILEMLETNQMPPESGPVALSPPDRATMIDEVSSLLGKVLDIERPSFLSYDLWLGVVREVGKAVPAERFEALVSEANAVQGSDLGVLSGRTVSTADHVVIERISEQACQAIARAEAALPQARRRYFKAVLPAAGRPLSEAVANMVVEPLLRSVFGERPAPGELAEGRAQLRTFARLTPSWTDAWIALCTTHLSSPRVLFLSQRRP